MEILAKNIEQDLLKVGIAIDGLWDEILGGMASRFKQVEGDITHLLSGSGFAGRTIHESKEVKVVAYEKDESRIIHIIVYVLPSGVWRSSRFLGYGVEAAGALKELESFYREKLKFSVEKI